MDNRTSITSTVTIEDIEEAMKELGQLKEVTPVIVDNKYIGNINVFGELTFDFDATVDTFHELFKEIPRNNKVVEATCKIATGKTTVMKINLINQITNVHRVRKGKRYIIKFDYTEIIKLIGEEVKR